jgi:hypothetical protein
MKAYWESGGIAPRIFTSVQDGGECLVLRLAAIPPQGKSLRHPLVRIILIVTRSQN